MNATLKKMFSVCIFGDIASPKLKDCIESASELTDRIILIDSDSNKNVQARATEFGVFWADINTLTSVAQSEWILFLNPDELVKILSPKKLFSQLNSSQKIYRVYVKDKTISTVLEEYQFVKNLGQYDKIGDLACVTRVDVRLAERDYAEDCLRTLIDNRKKMPFDSEGIIDGLLIETFFTEKFSETSEDLNEHDKRCLKGEIHYGPLPGEDVDEVSNFFIGFRLLHKGFLDGFIECARYGFGIDDMYLSMLRYLIKQGNFKESKELYEIWVKNRHGKETTSIYSAGGTIYAHLFMLDEAISCFEKAAEISPEASAFSNASKLYLIKGEKEKAVKALERAIEIDPHSEARTFFSVIASEEWRPLTLSLCMIAKDEEKTIGRALESMKNIADEIIVVDTGSSDRTKEIAREYGGKVIESEWADDFSATKNVALNGASGDYILFLDADEFIDIRDQIGLALFKKMLPPNCNIAYKVSIVVAEDSEAMSISQLDKFLKYLPVEQQVRIFPRHSTVHFTDVAFESVDASLSQANIQVADAKLFKITHRKENDKFRDERKIVAVTKSFSSLEDSVRAVEGGLFFLKLGDLKQAYPWFMKAEKAEPTLLAKVVTLYSRRNLNDNAKKIIEKVLENSPDSPELHLALAEVYFKEEKYTEVCDVLSCWINSGSDDTDLKSVADAYYYYYGTALLEIDCIAEGTEHIAIALERNPLNTRYQIGGLYAFAKSDQWEEFFEKLAQIISQENIEKEYEINGFFDIAQLMVELIQYFARFGKEEEANVCQRILIFLVRTKIGKKEDIDKIMGMINETSQVALV